MKVSLRKANALQQLVQSELNDSISAVATIGRFDNPEAVVNEAALKLIAAVDKKILLTDVLYSIRKKVSAAGATSGVSDLLADLAANEKRSQFIRELAKVTQFAQDKETVLAALEQLKTEKDAYGRYNNSFNVGLLTKETVDKYKSTVNTLRREKQTISDKLLHLNVATEIELDESEVAVLTKYEIL